MRLYEYGIPSCTARRGDARWYLPMDGDSWRWMRISEAAEIWSRCWEVNWQVCDRKKRLERLIDFIDNRYKYVTA